MDISSLEKISVGELNEDSDEYKSFLKELTNCAELEKNNVKILIDAEESWIQDSIDRVGLEMMRKYNKNSANVFITHQCYRTGTLDKIKDYLEIANKEKFILVLSWLEVRIWKERKGH